MAAVVGAEFKPTKGFLLQLKKRVSSVEEGHRLLELKRDGVASELLANLEELRVKKEKNLAERIENVLVKLAVAYASLGSEEITSQIRPIEKTLDLEVLPKSVMGILVPYFKIQHKPSATNKLGVIVRSVAQEFSSLIEELLQVAELESRVERLADDLEKTNRKVNALEKIVIPEYKRLVRQIENRIDQDMLEEFVRTRFVRTLISRKRTFV